MDLNKLILRKSWNQGLAGYKSRERKNVSLGNFRLVNNLGARNRYDKNTNVNSKWVSDFSEHIRFRKQMAIHKNIISKK
tara:strand:+ start:258 stop:494 length:237 start_codon:yes stop_codon:yes gene_type:complete